MIKGPYILPANNLIIKKHDKRMIKVLNFVAIILIIFGLDFGFLRCKSKFIYIAIKCWSIVVASSTIIIIIINNLTDHIILLWNSLYFIEYITYIVVLIFATSSIRRFFKSFLKFVHEFGSDSSTRVVLVTLLLTSLLFICDAVFVISYCYLFSHNCLHSLIANVCSFIENMTMDLIHCLQVLIFYVIYRQVKILRIAVELKFKRRFSDLEKGSIYSVSYLQSKYKETVDCLIKIKPVFDTLVIICTVIISSLYIFVRFYLLIFLNIFRFSSVYCIIS